MNEMLEEIAKAIFKSWFVDFDPVRAKMEGRPTGLSDDISALFPDELVDSEIGEVPKGWGVSNLSEIGRNRSITVKPSEMTSDLSYVGLEHLSRGHTLLSEWDSPENIGSNKTCFESGDILFGKLRPYFKKSVVVEQSGICSTDIVAIAPISLSTQFFVICTVSQQRFFDFISQGSTGTRMPRTSWKHMCEFQFAFPTESLLKVFQDIISPIYGKAFLNISENKTLSNLRDTLLPKLISGELQIPDADKFLEEANI